MVAMICPKSWSGNRKIKASQRAPGEAFPKRVERVRFADAVGTGAVEKREQAQLAPALQTWRPKIKVGDQPQTERIKRPKDGH